MDTKNIVELLQKFGKPEPPPPKKNNEENLPQFLKELYPYGQFPTQYVKGRQNTPENTAVHSQQQTQQNPAANAPSGSLHSTQNQPAGLFDGMDLQLLLPLMMGMNNKEKFSTADMFNLLMPTLGKDNPNLKEIVKHFTQNKKPSEDKKSLPPSKMQSIDSYIKV